MKFNKILIISLLLVFCITLGAVSATDIDNSIQGNSDVSVVSMDEMDNVNSGDSAISNLKDKDEVIIVPNEDDFNPGAKFEINIELPDIPTNNGFNGYKYEVVYDPSIINPHNPNSFKYIDNPSNYDTPGIYLDNPTIVINHRYENNKYLVDHFDSVTAAFRIPGDNLSHNNSEGNNLTNSSDMPSDEGNSTPNTNTNSSVHPSVNSNVHPINGEGNLENTGNPLFVLIIALCAIGLESIRRKF